MKKIISTVLSNILFILLLNGVFSGCSPTHENRMKTYEQAHNNHDIEKIMSLYDENITFDIVGSFRKVGKEQVRGLAEWDATTNSQMVMSDIKVNADTVTFMLKEGNDWFRSIGIEFMYYEPCKIVFSKGLIKDFKAAVTTESITTFQEIWPSIYQWLSEEKNQELSELIFDNKFVYNSENAKKWLFLLKEWKENANDNSKN